MNQGSFNESFDMIMIDFAADAAELFTSKPILGKTNSGIKKIWILILDFNYFLTYKNLMYLKLNLRPCGTHG